MSAAEEQPRKRRSGRHRVGARAKPPEEHLPCGPKPTSTPRGRGAHGSARPYGITICVSTEERQAIIDAARETGTSISGYVRAHVWPDDPSMLERKAGSRPTATPTMRLASKVGRPHNLIVAFSLEERAAIVQAASEAGLSMAAYFRALIWPPSNEEVTT